jgi:ATP-binding cassette subfamily B protein
MRGIFIFFKGKWSAIAAETIAKNIRTKLFNHIQYLSYDTHVKLETGDLVQRCTSDIDTVRQFLSVQVTEVARTLFFIIISITVMFFLNIKMTLIAISIVPFIFGFSFIFFLKIKKIFKQSDEAEGRMSTILQENLTGVRVVRAFARQSYEINKFDEKNINYRDYTYKLIKLLSMFWAVSDFLILSQTAIVIISGVYFVSIDALTIGAFVAFTIYTSMLLWPVRQMGRILSDMGKALVSMGRIKEILEKEIENPITDDLKPEIKGNIEFKNINFSYDNHKVLNDITFSVKQGERIAILGPTGSGKSSLIHLLLKLYDYQDGSIKIDGVELKKIDKKWIRKHIGITLQEPFLFSKSIGENISLSVDNKDKSKIIEAAQAAMIHDSIESFESSYDTVVGEQGVTLSGGQKQRVAIARTIIKEASIYIFDDSLSAVDTETDLAIRDALEKRNRNSTMFIISHRISTLSRADKILVIENGTLTQEGTHNELIKKEGLYKRIWEVQSRFGEQ